MRATTRRLWDEQDRHEGDRWRLFTAVAEAIPTPEVVLYPGSFVDVAPSFVWPSVTYVDTDDRAARFFADTDGVQELIDEHTGPDEWRDVTFVHGDYSADLGLPHAGFDVLVSLYAGFVSDHATPYLRPGGHLLVNPSHGDVALADVDPRYRLDAVVTSRAGEYRVRRDDLDSYLVPKREVDVTPEAVRRSGRGIAYTRSPFAYVFQRVA